MGFALIGLMLAGLLWALPNDGDSGDDSDNSETGDMVDDLMPEEPSPEPGDVGATVTERADGSLYVELGVDETGSLILINYQNTEDAGIGLREEYEQLLYILPEDTELPLGDPSVIQPDYPSGLTLTQLQSDLGIIPLAGWVLGSVDPIEEEPYYEDNTTEPPVIQANAPIAVYDVIATTDGDEIYSILPEGYEPPPPTHLGALEQVVTEDTTGNAAPDWLTAQADGIAIDGNAGDDLLLAQANNVTVLGGDGDDQIRAGGENAAIEGGEGSDTISIDGGVAFGGAGADAMTNYGVRATTLFGDGGADSLIVSAAGSQAHGGAGDDFLNLANGTIGYGDNGTDRIQMDSGARAFGGDGDDLFTVWNQQSDTDAAIATGGAGADTYDVRVWNPFGDDAEPYLMITDFDPAEDILQVGVFQTQGAFVEDVTLTEDANGSYTDVLIHFDNDDGREPGSAIVRLTGVTGLSADQIVILA